jgi:hypothetical protein
VRVDDGEDEEQVKSSTYLNKMYRFQNRCVTPQSSVIPGSLSYLQKNIWLEELLSCSFVCM